MVSDLDLTSIFNAYAHNKILKIADNILSYDNNSSDSSTIALSSGQGRSKTSILVITSINGIQKRTSPITAPVKVLTKLNETYIQQNVNDQVIHWKYGIHSTCPIAY